jgi:hypothetical protein
MFSRALAWIVVCSISLTLSAAEDDSPTYLTPADAGPDFVVQGEYEGDINADQGRSRWGAQIIALGESKFTLVGYDGGLPGNGWQRGKRTETADGRTSGTVTRFYGSGWEAEIRDGVLKVYSDGGSLRGTLKKVERQSPTLNASPPPGAVVLFDGTSADAFDHGQLTDDNLLRADCSSKQAFGDHKLHLEFRTPFKPLARGQERGNSGVYVQSRYEVQVLDSFGLSGENNECGGIYSIAQPAVNMCYPPLSWQTYDIDFTAAKYENGVKTQNARITIAHNGVKIMDDVELPSGTPGRLDEGPGPAPLFLQGHDNPVVYRNIWVVEKTEPNIEH